MSGTGNSFSPQNTHGKNSTTRLIVPRLAIAALLITIISLSALCINLALRNERLGEDYKKISDEASILRREIAQMEKLLDIAKGPNREYTSGNLVLSYCYWFSFYQDSNHTSGKPYVCVYIPEDSLEIELFVEAISASSTRSHLSIQKGTPDMDEPIPDLFVRSCEERFNSFTFDAPSAGWYTVSLVGHITPNFDSPGPGGSYVVEGNLYEVNAQLRVLRSQEAILFGVGSG